MEFSTGDILPILRASYDKIREGVPEQYVGIYLESGQILGVSMVESTMAQHDQWFNSDKFNHINNQALFLYLMGQFGIDEETMQLLTTFFDGAFAGGPLVNLQCIYRFGLALTGPSLTIIVTDDTVVETLH